MVISQKSFCQKFTLLSLFDLLAQIWTFLGCKNWMFFWGGKNWIFCQKLDIFMAKIIQIYGKNLSFYWPKIGHCYLGFPSVIGCIDGSHILVSPPQETEYQYVNRHHDHSLNIVAVCGPDHRFVYLNTNSPGSNTYNAVVLMSKLQKNHSIS
jgi:hypothetical protein